MNLISPADSELKFCPTCGNQLDELTDAVCSMCGKSLPTRAKSSYEYRSGLTLFGWPLVHVVMGRNDGQVRKPNVARGFIAIGEVAIGGIALGGMAVGGIAIGGCAIGMFTLAGASLGLLMAIGGLSISGGLALGGLAIGSVAMGGLSIGYYSFGGLALDSSRCRRLVFLRPDSQMQRKNR